MSDQGHWWMRLEVAIFGQANGDALRNVEEIALAAERMRQDYATLRESIHRGLAATREWQ